MRTKRRELKEQRLGRRPTSGEEYVNVRRFGSSQLSKLDSCYELIKMIAGAGVGFAGSAGVGMLRARRRDISIKPNRKLDRKSSRGVIYENEELRLRAINFNAEVEQGQNDIKKLRRENEQLRREIWSLRDEYDKLEEILKKQKSREESDEPEVRSETEAAGSECSDDEEDEDEEEEDDDEEGSESDNEEDDEDDVDATNNQTARQENTDNQKISSETLTVTPIQHRTLTVVHEEEEPKNKDQQAHVTTANIEALVQPTTYPFHTTSFEQPYPITTTSLGYSLDSPFSFPATTQEQLMTAYPQVHHHHHHHQPATAVVTQTSSFDMGIFEHPRVTATPPPPPGWQSGLSATTATGNVALLDVTSNLVKPPEEFRMVGNSTTQAKSLAERRRAFFKHYGSRDNGSYSDKAFRRSIEALDAISDPSSSHNQPRHFFAPLPTKCRSPCDVSPMEALHETMGSDHGNSPANSEKTSSTVISRERYENGHGRTNSFFECNDKSPSYNEFFTTDSCLANTLTKSLSCQDLNSRVTFAETLATRNDQLTKSDSTLDSASIKAYKSQLNVTLRQPNSQRKSQSSPDIPEIPRLPRIDYKLFNNPFLQNFEQAYQNFPMRTEGQSPLSLQVCESPVSGAGYSSPVRMQPSFTSPITENDYTTSVTKRRDLERLRLMIPSNGSMFDPTAERQQYQVTSFESPSPHTLQIPPMTPYELEALRRMPTGTTPLGQSPQLATPRLYQNVPFTPGLRHETPVKISTMTQTSLPDDQTTSQPSSPQDVVNSASNEQQQTKKRRSRKDKAVGNSTKEKTGGSIKRRSPSSTRRKDQLLKKQSSVVQSSKDDIPETPRSRGGDSEQNCNESRSSSSGQDSPRKEQTKRVSLYFSARKRPSLTSSRTSRSRSIENNSRYLGGGGGSFLDNSINPPERDRTNSISSREAARDKQQRRTSTSSGSVPWCACWGNGCI